MSKSGCDLFFLIAETDHVTETYCPICCLLLSTANRWPNSMKLMIPEVMIVVALHSDVTLTVSLVRESEKAASFLLDTSISRTRSFKELPVSDVQSESL